MPSRFAVAIRAALSAFAATPSGGALRAWWAGASDFSAGLGCLAAALAIVAGMSLLVISAVAHLGVGAMVLLTLLLIAILSLIARP